MTRRRIVSLWLPRFATARLARERMRSRERQPSRPSVPDNAPTDCRLDRPLVTVRAVAGRAIVAMADARVGAGGILPGMALADARALMPDIAVRPADPAGDATALAKLADWCGRYTPWTAVEDRAAGALADDAAGDAIAEGVWLDITGCAHLAGGETALIEDLLYRVQRFGFDARAGLADTSGAAWAAARFLAPANRFAILPPGGQRAALARLPVAALRLDGETASGLDRLGLRRIDDLYPLPRAALARRFGAIVGQRLDQALGRIEEPISPRRPVPRHIVRLAFPEPVLDESAIAGALARLMPTLCRGLEAEGLGVRRLTLTLYRIDGSLRELAVGTAQPGREPEALLRLVLPRLETVDPGFGIEAVTLAASVAEPLSALQLALRGRVTGNDATGAGAATGSFRAAIPLSSSVSAEFDNLLDRIGNRVGFEALRKLAPRDSHMPERAQRRVAVERSAAMPSWWRERSRPLRLLAEPAPVAVTEDHAGMPVALRAGDGLRRIPVAAGPERVAPEWWRPAGESANGSDQPVRDYWRVEDEDGGRFWLCRERSGNVDGEAGGNGARWLLHGLFA